MEVTPFTCVGDWHGAPVAPVGRREWEDIRQRPSLAELCRLIEAGNEELKRRLPVWTPHCSQFRNNHRSIADAERPLQRLMLDFDEKGHSMEILEKSRQLQEQGKWKILLVEESVRRGTHVLIALPEGMSAEEAQKRFSHDVGFQADAAVKDVSRCIYMVPMEHTLYMCQELFEGEEESIKNEELRMMNEELNDKHKEEKNSSFPTSFKGTPYTDIIAEWFRRKGGEPVEGERNDKLFRLAVQLRCITDRNEAHLLEIMPRYGLSEEEMKNIIHSACTTRYSGMSRFMESILRTLSAEPEAEEGAPEVSTFYIASESPPPMPPLKQCPPLIRLLLSNTPDIYCPAVAHAVFPALGAHLWRTYFPYIDNVLHEATFMNVLIAPTASGKSCINEPVNSIMADIRERDRINLAREREWKREMQTKGANKDKRQRP